MKQDEKELRENPEISESTRRVAKHGSGFALAQIQHKHRDVTGETVQKTRRIN